MSEFEKEFYERAIKQEGVDYSYYGDWQKNYARMVCFAANIIPYAANNRTKSIFLDIGCACGVTLRAFRETTLFNKCIGVDISKYMLEIGRKEHSFTPEEMIEMDVTNEKLPADDNSVVLINCTDTMEHLTKEKLPFVLDEIKRVLVPKIGVAWIIVPAVKDGNPIEEVSRERTHYIIETETWWKKTFASKFAFGDDVLGRFKIAKHSPTGHDPKVHKSFYEHYGNSWTVFCLRKEG